MTEGELAKAYRQVWNPSEWDDELICEYFPYMILADRVYLLRLIKARPRQLTIRCASVDYKKLRKRWGGKSHR